jgi:hypothetical protein
MGVGFGLDRLINSRIVAEEARLPAGSKAAQMIYPVAPSQSKRKPKAIMVARNIACPAITVVGFFNQAASPSLCARMATLKG